MLQQEPSQAQTVIQREGAQGRDLGPGRGRHRQGSGRRRSRGVIGSQDKTSASVRGVPTRC